MELIVLQNIRAFLLVWKDGRRVRLQVAKNGFYTFKIVDHHYHVAMVATVMHIIIVGTYYVGETLQKLNKELVDSFHCKMVQHKDDSGTDLNDVLKALISTYLPNASYSIDTFIDVTERMTFLHDDIIIAYGGAIFTFHRLYP